MVGEGRGGMNREIRFDINISITMCKLASRKPPSSRGSSAQRSVMTSVVGGRLRREGMYVYM